MYTSFYELDAKPFQISSDPDFMWFGEKHNWLVVLRKNTTDLWF